MGQERSSRSVWAQQGREESWDTTVAEAKVKTERPEAGQESHFIWKMPESGDERTIRPNESQGEAGKADMNWAKFTVPSSNRHWPQMRQFYLQCVTSSVHLQMFMQIPPKLSLLSINCWCMLRLLDYCSIALSTSSENTDHSLVKPNVIRIN